MLVTHAYLGLSGAMGYTSRKKMLGMAKMSWRVNQSWLK